MEDGERYMDRFGQPMSNASGFTITRAIFDQFGNMLSRFNYNGAGDMLDNPRTGYAGYRFTWDQTGLREERLDYWHADGAPAVHMERGYHRVTQRHDDHGNVIALRYEGIDGRPVNRLDNGVAIIRNRYDEHQRLIERRFCDANQRPVVVGDKSVVVFTYREDGYRR